MSLTRNKRKRPENDPTTMAAPSRRRSRDSRATDDSTSEFPIHQDAESKTALGEDVDTTITTPTTTTTTTITATSNQQQQQQQQQQGPSSKSEKVNSKSKSGNADHHDVVSEKSMPPLNENPGAATEQADPGAGSTDDGSVPKLPLHVSTGGNNAPNSDPDTNDRASQIRALIAHRSLLLSRIRSCRNVADKRLADTKAVAQTTGDTTGRAGGSLREMTDDDEIEAHRELTKNANQAAKKARGEGEVQTEKGQRTSLSLRRGSSVGKRMNAALSSLAPGAAYSTTGHISPAHVQPPTSGDFFPGSVATVATEQIIPGPMTVGTATPHPSKSAKAASSHSIPRQSSISGPDGKQNRPSAGKSSKSVTQSIPRAASVTKLEQIPSSARPVHQVPPRIPQPKSNFTQAMMLRKKRDEINSKLAAVMQRRGVGKTLRKLPPVPHDTEIPPKVDLPKRRKTHWDRLLQEMSWLATDFIEERKWKVSSARAMSHAISSSGITVGNINSSLKKPKNTPLATNVDMKPSPDTTRNTPLVQEKEKETRAVSLAEMKYIKPSSDDIKMAKKASRLASSMISELVIVMNKAGVVGQTDEVHTEAIERFSKVRAKLLNITLPVENPSTGNDDDMNKEESSDTNAQTTLDQTTTGTENQSDEGEVTFSDINQRIKDLGPVPKKKDKFPFKDVIAAAIGRKLKFSNDQKDIVEFIDTIWSTSSAGAMLSGIPSSGKTVATCCLLWKHRNGGPQVIICPPASLLRWKYEMLLFKDLRVLNFGFVGGIGCALRGPSIPKVVPGPGDVVLCEYASVGKILSLVRDKKVNFFSLCIDCRHPEGMFGSIATNNSKGRANSGWHGPTELLSGEWWDNVIALASRNDPKRLLLDYCDSDPYSLERSGLGQRQQLEIMSLRTAFVVGPRTFRPSNYSIPRTVITWARHQGKKSGEDKFERVRRVLEETIAPLSTRIRKTLHSLPFTTWEIRECEMPGAQRAAYDSCCAHIRGALSSPLGDLQSHDDFGSRTFHAVAAALFRLRQLCLCSSNLETAEQGGHQLSSDGLPFLHTEPCSVDATPTEGGPFKMASDNSSQPDYELAEVLMNNSGKFTQLVSILESECGYVPDDEIQNSRNEKLTDSSLRAQSKVVILANLPRTQWLVSILLGSLGIRHKLIRREFSHSPTASKNEVKKHNQAALSWAEAQLVLTAFNLEEEIRDRIGIYSGADVLIVSPDSLASWHGGVGIDAADFVISLDEDWSGREMATLEAALSRWKACMTLRKSTSKTIRLICKESIETKLFSKKSRNAFQSPLDQSGSHMLYRAIDELIPVYQEAIDARTSSSKMLPGINVLQLRGEALNDVLMSSVDLAPLFETGSTMLFLPLKDENGATGNRDDNEIGRELYFLRALFELESRETSKDLSASFTDSFTFTKKLHFGSGVLPPEPRSFPEQVMSRSDLQFLSVRYYFERQVQSLESSSSTTSGVALGLLSSTGESVPSNVVSISANADQDGSAMVDAWKKSGLGLKPDEMAKSLLCYRANQGRKASKNDDHAHTFRHNAYAQIYSSSWDRNLVRDGSQGCEAVVFCPPLFPKMQLAPYPSKNKPQIASPDDNTRKRKKTPESTVAPPNSFREPKQNDLDFPQPGDSNSKRRRTDPMADVAPSPQNGDFVTGEPMPMDDDFLSKKNDVPVPEPTIPRTPRFETSQERTSKPLQIADAEKMRADEDDYGFLGSGALPLPVYSALLMANESTSVGKASGGMDDCIQDIFPCDSEEAATSSVAGRNDETLRLMALVVRKRPKTSSQFPLGHVHHPQHGLVQEDQRRLPPPPGNPADLVVTSQLNGDEIGKKIKKKVSSQIASSAFTRIPTIGVSLPSTTPMPAIIDGKTGPKHRMLAAYTSRRLATGLSMFESASYRTAMMHVQNRVKKRVEMALMKTHLASDSGPGIPMFASNQPKAMTELGQGVVHFGNMVVQLKEGSTTGDAAKSLATAQRSALRRSLVSPCRVDFGPFQSGFLGSPAGMTAISPPRSRLGVSLPMGVKVAPSVHDNTAPAWTAQEDKHLREAAVKYGMNWIVIARALSGVDGFVVAETHCRLASLQRSARQCRDRWQSLARSQPSLAGEVRKSEKILRENALKSAESLVDENVHSASVASFNGKSKVALLSRVSLLQSDTHNDNKMDCDPPLSHEAEQSNALTSPHLRPKPSFSILKSAMAKRDVVPLTLPGIPPSGQSNQPVPSHPSHMQSVQTSVSAQLSNGRTEMWPLQILDCADKHRTAARTSSSQRSTEVPPATASSTLARKPASTSGSVVSPTNNPPVPTNTRPLPTAVPTSTAGGPSRAHTGQRPSPTSNPSPPKAKAALDTTKQVTPKPSPVTKSTDNSKPSAK